MLITKSCGNIVNWGGDWVTPWGPPGSFALCENEATATRFCLCENEATATRFCLCESEATATTKRLVGMEINHTL
ncbi:hypothetical protein [Lysinibacillus sp. fls2-241-R2A-57]|uniref:hypothetical protein n=1 Tax=Lysinibacillus sp. fls2-241-R2A-57 TaxID=3040292 RepID=UPI002556E44C|nr:hypothetical protein [Lysinibacillus sp. fls2-241-R2A-57]